MKKLKLLINNNNDLINDITYIYIYIYIYKNYKQSYYIIIKFQKLWIIFCLINFIYFSKHFLNQFTFYIKDKSNYKITISKNI